MREVRAKGGEAVTTPYKGSACPVCRHPTGHYERCDDVKAVLEALRKATASVEAWQFQRGKPSLLRTALRDDVSELFAVVLESAK